jgi:hypothetical protein
MDNKPIPSQVKAIIEETVNTFRKLQAGEIAYSDIKGKREQEEQLTTLQVVGYDRLEAAKLLKKYSFDYLYKKAVSVESNMSVSEAFGEIEKKEEYKRIMSRKKIFMKG